MYTSFVYATNGGNVTLLLTNLATGNYDFYLYGHGNTNDANTVFQLWAGGRDWDVRGATIWGLGYSNSTVWDESQQYIVYHDIPVDSNQVVTIIAGHDPYGSANLNGMQIVYKGSYDTNSDWLPSAWMQYYFGGTSAIRSVGAYLKEHNATVTAFYTSNVEQYLFMSDSWKKFYGNVAALPLDSKSVFIRPLINVGTGAYSSSPLFRPGFWWDTRLFPMSDLVDAFNAGMIQGYYDIIGMPN